MCGYRKDFSTQHAHLSLIEKWKRVLDNKGYGGAIIMDFSKVLDTINHDLLIAKLHVYGFSKESLKLIKSYLTNRWQITKLNTGFSKWTEILLGVPQGSVLGPLLFNIYIKDLFFLVENTNICNYGDETTFFACDSDLHYLISRLEHDYVLVIEWFECNYMKRNHDKCHLLISGHKYESVWANIGSCKVWESNDQKLLEINIDRNLKFKLYILRQCIKAGRKLSVLTRICKFLSLERRSVLVKFFIEFQLAYCLLIWM